MRAAFIFPILLVSGLATAGQDAMLSASPTGCVGLLTEAECHRHLETLAGLQDPEARRVYLAGYAAMVREREVMCGGHGRQQVLARAQYR